MAFRLPEWPGQPINFSPSFVNSCVPPKRYPQWHSTGLVASPLDIVNNGQPCSFVTFSFWLGNRRLLEFNPRHLIYSLRSFASNFRFNFFPIFLLFILFFPPTFHPLTIVGYWSPPAKFLHQVIFFNLNLFFFFVLQL